MAAFLFPAVLFLIYVIFEFTAAIILTYTSVKEVDPYHRLKERRKEVISDHIGYFCDSIKGALVPVVIFYTLLFVYAALEWVLSLGGCK